MGKNQPAKVLVVEDEFNTSILIQGTLKDLGYEVAGTATSGEEAILKCNDTHPDLVLMDILLGGNLDGVGAAQQIRTTLDIPVVYLTAYADENTIHRAKLSQPYGFIVKPFENQELHAAIEIALYKHRLPAVDSGWSHSALKSIADAVIITDTQGNVSFMNSPAEGLTGWRSQEAIGTSLTVVFNVVKEAASSLSDSSVTKAFRDQAILICKDQTRIPVDYSVGMIRDERNTGGFVVVFRNISERNRAEVSLRESRKKYKELVNSIDGIVWESEGDTHQFTFVSKQAQQLLGYPLNQWMNEASFWQDHLHPDDREEALEFWRKALSNEKKFEFEYRMIAEDGRTVWVRDIVSLMREEGGLITLRGVMLDITNLKVVQDALRKAHNELEKRVEERTLELSQVVEALRESEERYALAAQGANDGLWDWNLKTDEIYYSTRWKTMLGWEKSEILNSSEEWFQRVHPDDIERVKAEIATHLDGLTPHFETEHRMQHKDGSYHWMLNRGVAVRDSEGRAYRMAGSQTDITERKLAEEQLLHDAFHDALTNLSNRALFMDRLSSAVARGKRRDDYFFGVLFLDVDRFKVINDSLGHILGDQLLIAIARRLESCLRPGDTVARLGGDEFSILLEDITDVTDCTRVAERILQELTVAFNLKGHEVFATASIGIAPFSQVYDRAEDILRDADTAMYRAKALGKARHQVFDKTMHARAVALLQLETDLRRAVERQEFRLFYQPIVNLRTLRIQGFEALVRWQHPHRGLLPPSELIPVAEETGLIVPIGRWVLQEACRQMQEWHTEFPTEFPLSISVNLSGKQLSQPDLIQDVYRVLQETHLEADSLTLEITESVIMENAETAASMLAQLRELDVHLHIDDFGTGYSSLSYLHRFPVNTLKVDRSFVNRIGVDDENTEIVKTILTLAKNLGMDVIAEGVETHEQLKHLRTLGCHYAQGFLFSMPVDSDHAKLLIADLLVS